MRPEWFLFCPRPRFSRVGMREVMKSDSVDANERPRGRRTSGDPGVRLLIGIARTLHFLAAYFGSLSVMPRLNFVPRISSTPPATRVATMVSCRDPIFSTTSRPRTV